MEKHSENKCVENPKGIRKSNDFLIKRCVRIIDYLKHNTDKNHTITQAKMRKDPEISKYLGSKQAFNKLVVSLTEVMNCMENGSIKDENDWRVVYRSFAEAYGFNEDEANNDIGEEDDGAIDKKLRSIKDLYYNHVFSEGEVTEIINALRLSKLADDETRERIISKIKKEFVSKYYREYSCRIYNAENTDSESLKANLNIIQEAISRSAQISYKFNYYNRNKKLTSVRKRKTVISPYFIVVDQGRYYLIGNFEFSSNKGDKNFKRKIGIVRIDLMTEVRILKANKKIVPITPKDEVEGVPQIIENDFKTLHMNMSYEDPTIVRLKVYKKINDDINYNFIHDYFGDNYTFIESKDDGDIISVRCSKFGIVSWALQFSDAAEVIYPDNVKNAIKERVKALNNKYLNN